MRGILTRPAPLSDRASEGKLWTPQPYGCGCRLSLDPTRSVPIADQTAKTAIHVVPHVSDTIELWDGERWVPRRIPYDLQSTPNSRRTSLDISNTSNATTYDVYMRWVSGSTPELKWVPWNSTTVRSTTLAISPDIHPDGLGLFQGRFVQAMSETGTAQGQGIRPDWLYLGTFYTSATGQCECSRGGALSIGKWFLWNMFNRRTIGMRVWDTTNSWNYTTDTWRQVGAVATNQLEIVRGLDEDSIRAIAGSLASNSGGANAGAPGIGISSTSVNSAVIYGLITTTGGAWGTAYYHAAPGLGYRTIVWLEKCDAASTQTWYGDGGNDNYQTGLAAEILA